MLDYLDEVRKLLHWNCHSFEVIALPQRHELPNVGRDGNSPSQEELKEYIAETHFSEDGSIKFFDVYCVTAYDKLGKAQKLNTPSGVEMGTFVNKMTGM